MFLLSAASMSVDQTCCNHLRNEESCRVSQVPQARARLAPDLPPDVIHAALWGQGPEAAADTGRLERPLWLCQKTAGVDGAFEEHKRRLKRGHGDFNRSFLPPSISCIRFLVGYANLLGKAFDVFNCGNSHEKAPPKRGKGTRSSECLP